MKEVFLTEEQLQNLDEIAKEIFNDERDPRSLAYVRKLKRPKVSLVKILLLFVFLPAVTLAVLIVSLLHFGLPKPTILFIAAILLTAYILLAAKRMFINAIKLYQRYAPASLRNKCRFEPSCSEYMILAVEKYGLIKGVQRGVERLKRCNIDGGGFDFP